MSVTVYNGIYTVGTRARFGWEGFVEEVSFGERSKGRVSNVLWQKEEVYTKLLKAGVIKSNAFMNKHEPFKSEL